MNKPFTSTTAADLPAEDLVTEGRVHSAIYTDPAIFDQEMDRIFQHTWVYIGHGSEVPKKGDFRLRKIGRQPVIMVRAKDGEIKVLMNRCLHRGAVVAEVESGNTNFFHCWFHGWTYDTDGTLVQVTKEEGYEPGFCKKMGGLARPPRVEEYRGFVFACLDDSVPPLRDHLGQAADLLNYMIDVSPTGTLHLDMGVNKTVYRGNWKLVGMDGYHVNYVHASVLESWSDDTDAGIAAMHKNDPFDDKALTRTRDLGRGHVLLDFREHRMATIDKYLDFLRGEPGGEDYLKSMNDAYGEDQAKHNLSLAGDPHLGVFPNLQVIGNQIRIVNPISADETEVLMFPVRLGDVPDEINTLRLRQHESFYGPSSAGSPDDAEIFERVQQGMKATVNPWIDMSRGLHREVVEEDGTRVGKISDETTQRGQMREWRRLMKGA
ncbi:MAG: Rieske 2Fe-2S domain-containing protein [Marinosulfonomonas sp.]|nr:Rieske 2Fe-2S domain-containing protein [Marinosulfonomonas sp.]